MPSDTAALCQERPFATWRAAMRQPGATDYRLCAQHGAWHAVTATTTAACHPVQEFFTISRPMLEAFLRASKSYYGSPGPGRERPHARDCQCDVCEARQWAEGVLMALDTTAKPPCLMHGCKIPEHQHPATAALDVDAIEAKWLQLCGYCDAGMQTYCRCPEEDHRVVISDLVAEIRRLRDAV